MSAEVVPIDNTPEVALAYAEAGFRVFPIKWGTKEPATAHGFHDATTDADQVRKWWRGRHNLGLATGPQPNGWNLLAVDIDTDKGGKLSFLDLVDRYEARELLSAAPQHLTPRGGWHLFFDAPEDYRNTRERIGAGIDTRGAGGYVVLPPSRWANEDGELKLYVAKPGLGLLERPPLTMPGWLLEELRPQATAAPAPVSLERRSTPQMTHDSGAFDWARENEFWPDTLLRHAWMPQRSQPNGDQLWRRPGKMDRGHSAVLHPSGAFVVFTTEVPSQLEGLGVPTKDGTGFTVSIGDFICAYEHGGNRSAFAREVRRRMPAPVRTSPGAGAAPALTESHPSGQTVAGSFLPEEFWEARPVFGEIRQSARARMVGPDALFMNVLLRWATMVPPTYKLPPLIGGAGTFDLIGCVVAETGGGKSAAIAASRDVVRCQLKDLLFDIPLGSGEGVAQMFMVDELDEKGKKTGRQSVGRQAVHFVVDEATAFIAAGGRRGSTVIQTLNSAWSGATLGQANAAQENRRIIEGGRVRVTATMGMQSSNAWMLFDQDMSVVGFTGRLLFARGEDPTSPDVLPEPGVPAWFPVLPQISGGVTLAYDEAVTAEIIASRQASLRGVMEGDKTISQHGLLRCKIAGLFALQENRRTVTVGDWTLAGTVVEASVGVLRALQALRAGQVARQSEAKAASRGELEFVAEDAKERRAVAALGDRIVAKVLEASDEVPYTRRKLAREITSSSTRHRFEPALDWAINSGRVKIDNDHVLKP